MAEPFAAVAGDLDARNALQRFGDVAVGQLADVERGDRIDELAAALLDRLGEARLARRPVTRISVPSSSLVTLLASSAGCRPIDRRAHPAPAPGMKFPPSPAPEPKHLPASLRARPLPSSHPPLSATLEPAAFSAAHRPLLRLTTKFESDFQIF
jgi:hypothetical protein